MIMPPGTVKIVRNCGLSGSAQFAKKGTQVLFYAGNSLYACKMKS